MRRHAFIATFALFVLLASRGSVALAQDAPSLPPAPNTPAPTDPELPPWAQNADEPEGRWRRLCRWVAGEFEEAESCPPRIWFKAEYIFAYIRDDRTPILATTGLTTDATPGALGLPFTRILYGGDIQFDDRSGLRFTLGGAINESLAVEANWFFLDGRKPRYDAGSPGSPVIARPFTNLNSGIEDASLTTYPGLLSGAIHIESYSFLEGAELNARTDFWAGECCRIRGLVGLRWLNLREGLSIEEDTQVTMAGPLSGLPIGDIDRFRTRNDFFGGQLGLDAEFRYRRFTLDLFGKCALGDVVQEARIDGATNLFGVLVPGGLFAVGSNMGQYERDRLGVIPEAGARVEMTVGPHLSVFVGYSFLYMNDVVRPGGLVDPGVNVNLVPSSTTFGNPGGPVRPAVRFESTDFYVHMFQMGMTVRW
jgi:hypothetical protein